MAQRKKHSDSASRQTATNSYQVAGKTAANGMVFQVDRKDPVILLSVSASVQDLRSLDMEKETKEIVRESPRGILEDCMRSLETESETSMASTSSYSEAPGNACIASYWGGFFNFWKKRSLKRLSTFPPLGVPKLSKRYTRSARENPTSIPLIDEAHLCCFKPSWRNFSLTEISAATSNFSSENIIGKGGYAEVYKGCLQDGQLVAIKRLTRGTAEERIADFLSEIGIIVHINHPNAAKLIGFCVEGGMHLVLQLSPHGSLASRLHDSNEKLDWSIRYKVALGTAEGLNYLHVGCQRRIIHRDIKAANILLTEDFEPQICDFGLAKWLPDQWTHHTVSNFEGTFGYIAPEYFMHGIVNEKTDVFAFGVLLLELITGRKALDCSQQSLVMWAKPLLDKNDMRELIDPSLDDVYDPQQMHHVALAASLSIQHSPLMRPNMGQIVQLLKGEGSLESIKLSQRPLLQRTYSEELFDANEYNSTRYLNDLNRHRQLALDF